MHASGVSINLEHFTHSSALVDVPFQSRYDDVAHQGSWADAVSRASSEHFGDDVSEYNTSDDEPCYGPPAKGKQGPSSGLGLGDSTGSDAEKGAHHKSSGRESSYIRGVNKGGGGRGGGRVGGDRSGAGMGLGRGAGTRVQGPGIAPAIRDLDISTDKSKGKGSGASGLPDRGDPESALKTSRADQSGKNAVSEGPAGRLGGRLGGRRGWSGTRSAPNNEGISVPSGGQFQSKTR